MDPEVLLGQLESIKAHLVAAEEYTLDRSAELLSSEQDFEITKPWYDASFRHDDADAPDGEIYQAFGELQSLIDYYRHLIATDSPAQDQ